MADQLKAPDSLGARPEEEKKGDGWWCPKCKRWLEGTEVTFGEYHDPREGGCGEFVGVKKGDGSRALADAARQNWLMSRPDVQTYDSAGRPVVFLYPPGNASRIPIYGEDYKHARACAETLLRYLSPVPPAEGPAKPAERSEAEQPSPSPQPKDSGEALREAMRKFEAENVICPKCSTTIPKWKIGWPVVPAASHAAMKKALAGLLERYVNVVCSGDCGNWNPDDDPAVIAARSALSETGEGAK